MARDNDPDETAGRLLYQTRADSFAKALEATRASDSGAIAGSDHDNVSKFPEQEKPPGLLIGPFSEYRVVVDGRLMPLLTGLREGDKIWLIVDGRFACGPFGEEEAHQAARLAGQAMAVTAGYAHLGAASRDQPFAPQCSELPFAPRGPRSKEVS